MSFNRTWTFDDGMVCNDQSCNYFLQDVHCPENLEVSCYSNKISRENQEKYLLSVGMTMKIKLNEKMDLSKVKFETFL